MTQLCFEIGECLFAFAEINTRNKEIVRFEQIEIDKRSQDLKKEEVTAFINLHGLQKFDGDVSLSVVGLKSTLVPQIIFGDTSAKEVFQLCFGESSETIEHKRFYEQMIVNVYEVQDWIKSLFVIRFPLISIEHETTHLLRGIFAGNTFEPALHIAPNQQHFSLMAVSKNKLDFFNTFEFENLNDLLYYTMHILNNADHNKKVKIFWHQNEQNDDFNDFKNL
jgi:hypothetical protein